jgi:molybdopterin/thiamine biosynthesis adenylyltransferase
MSNKKASININQRYLALLMDSVLKGESFSLDFLCFENSSNIYFYPINSFSESLVSENSNFRTTKIKINPEDEIDSLLDLESNGNNLEFNWKWESKKLKYITEFISNEAEKISIILSYLQSSTRFYKNNEIISLEITYPHSKYYSKVMQSQIQNLKEDQETIHSRNLLWLGEDNFFKIKNLKIGCVGAGGLNNPFVVQAMHHGYTNFVLVDADTLEIHNFNRFLGAKKSQLGRLKVDILKEILCEFLTSVEVEAIPNFFPEKSAIDALSTCDILVGGVDNDYSRLQIQILALCLEKPYLDMGSGVLLKDNHSLNVEIEERGGQIKLFIPGEACISCMGLNPSIVKDFNRFKLDVLHGYIMGTELTPASILSLNNSISSMAIKLLTDYITNEGTNLRHLKYNEKSFKLYSVKTEKSIPCKVCGMK